MENNVNQIVIQMTSRFEELNVFCDILKNNFKSNYNINVFCNLSLDHESDIKKNVDFSLIDNFFHIPDSMCKKGVVVKTEAKRRQPLDALIKILRKINSLEEIDKFIFTECDIFPIKEKEYLQELNSLNESTGVSCRYIPIINPKVPNGYISPGPLYINKAFTGELIKALEKKRDIFLNSGVAYEGAIASSIILASKISGKNINRYSPYFCSNYEWSSNLEPITFTTHQHNILNLKNAFVDNKITSGRHVEKVIKGSPFIHSWYGEKIESSSSFKIEKMPLYGE